MGWFWFYDYHGGKGFSGDPLATNAWDPHKSYTFHMWKKEEAETLVRVACSVPVEPYGTNWYAVNLVTGQAGDFQNADFLFWFETTKDANGNFARQFHFRVVDGGLAIDTNPYPYRAPESGYKSEWDWSYEPYGRNSNDDANSVLKKEIYVKVRGGKVFGAITWNWGATYGVGITGYLNPNGSPNLEPDSDKLITDPAEIRRIDEQTARK